MTHSELETDTVVKGDQCKQKGQSRAGVSQNSQKLQGPKVK